MVKNIALKKVCGLSQLVCSAWETGFWCTCTICLAGVFEYGSEQKCHEEHSSVQDSRTWVEVWNWFIWQESVQECGLKLKLTWVWIASTSLLVCLTSPSSPCEKEATAQATLWGDGWRQVWERVSLVQQDHLNWPKTCKIVAHIINPRGNHTIRLCHWFSTTRRLEVSIPLHFPSKL